MSPTSSTRTSAEATKSAAAVPAVDARRGDDALPDPTSTAPLLEVTDLKVSFPSEDGRVNAVRGVNLSVARGEVLALVGESGSGKSVTSTAVMGLLDESAEVTGSVRLHGTELLGRPDGYMSRIRGSQVAMVFQDPLSALTPVYTVGAQIVEALRIHQPEMSEADAHKRAVELLDLVGIPNPQVRAKAYPTSSPAACASGPSSPSRSPTTPISSSPTSPPRPSTSPSRPRSLTCCVPPRRRPVPASS